MQNSDDRPQSTQGLASSESRRDDEIGTPPLLVIRHLLSKDRSQANLGHARPPQHPLALDQSGSRNDDHIVAPALPAGLEQERYFEYYERLPPRAGAIEKPPFLGGNHRVQNRFEPGERGGVRKDPLPEKSSVNPAGLGFHSRKCVGNRPNRVASRREEAVNDPIGIEQWEAKAE